MRDTSKDAPTLERWTGSTDQVAALCKAVFGAGPSDVAGVPAWVKAGAVLLAESHGNPAAVNPIPVDGGCKGGKSKHATGVFQIIPNCHPQYDEKRLFDPVYNAGAAAEISRKGTTWSAWSTGHGPGRKPSEGAWTTYRRGIERSAAPPSVNFTAEGAPGGGLGGLSIFGLPHIPNPLDTAGDAADALKAVGELVTAQTRVLKFVTDSDNWMRILWVALGAGLVSAGIMIMARDTVARIGTAVATDGLSEVGRAAT